MTILGLPLNMAIARLRAAGAEPREITEIRAPRGTTPRGTLRVVRECDGALIVARFLDGAEENSREAT